MTASGSARLIAVREPARAEAAVVVLHGGAARRGAPGVRRSQLSVLRMVPIARRLARAGSDRLAVFRLLNSERGWSKARTPVDDAGWALGLVRGRYGDVPVGLVGHSLGGRAALLAGGLSGVRGVVALNPWVYPTDRADLAGRRVLVVHGTADRVADLGRARAVVSAIAEHAEVELVEVAGGDHAMLRHGAEFERLAVDFTVRVLLTAR